MSNEVTINQTYLDKEIVYYVKSQKWTYAGTGENVVKTLNPKLHSEITVILNTKVAEYQDRVKREDDARREQEMQAKIAKQNAFKTDVNGFLQSDFIATYPEISKDTWVNNEQVVYISKSDIDATVSFDGTVSRSRGIYAVKTDMPWVRNFNYKRQRFGTLEKAILNACKCINDEIKHKAYQDKSKADTKSKRKAISNKLISLGIVLYTKTKWIHSSRPGRGYEQVSDKVKIVIKDTKPDNTYSDKIEVSGSLVSLNDAKMTIDKVGICGKFTPEQFKQLAEFITLLDIKPSSNYD